MKNIKIKNARSNNLKNLTLEIPRNKLVVITGPSGCGKSSLAFDTIYKEGQRRFLESLSSFGRTFLQSIERPLVDSIEGLSPTVAIDQKTTGTNPRSTVGTITEVYNYLRMLYSHIAIAHSPVTKKPIHPQNKDNIIKDLVKSKKGTRLVILSPILSHKKGEHRDVLTRYENLGFTKIRVNGEIQFIDEPLKVNIKKFNNVDLVIDRIIVKEDSAQRIEESLLKAFEFTKDTAIVLKDEKEIFYSLKYYCTHSQKSYPALDESLFSFNSPLGFCPSCQGIGYKEFVTEESVFFDKSTSILDGPLGPLLAKEKNIKEVVEKVYGKHSIETALDKLPKALYRELVNGSKNFKGLISFLNVYLELKSDKVVQANFSHIISKVTCSECHGYRLNAYALSALIGNDSIGEVSHMPIEEFQKWVAQTEKKYKKHPVAKKLLKEISERTQFLVHVGLDYLSLSRTANSLSGGEYQRIRLSSQLGSLMSGIVYILDEPSIGLHQRDNMKLIETLLELKNRDNCVIVVEHDEETMRNADHIIDIGPGSGREGGEIVVQGKFNQIVKSNKSITAKYLSGKEKIPEFKKRDQKKFIELLGASEHNLKNVDSKFPLGNFICLTGVSGSGKSTLIHRVLLPALRASLSKRYPVLKNFKKIKGVEHIHDLISIDQKPIGRTPKSIPLTYTGIFSRIRDIFAATNEAKLAGLKAGDFSFNVKSGQCKSCEGNGKIKYEMPFLSDVYNVCPKCLGKRYKPEVLEITYKGLNIHDILNLTVSEGLDFFSHHKKISFTLQTLSDVGLGYLKLGQSSPTLSGGEAQRVKLSRELSKIKKGHCFYVLDEPTTGLHFHDIVLLLKSINRLIDAGNTVLVIEHNLDVVKSADYIIDLGPGGGKYGGEVVVQGKPDMVLKCKNSFTGKYLKKHLKGDKK